jgi:hypothetical protein
MTAENLLAARDLRDILSQRSRSTSPASPLAARPPSPFPLVLAGTAVTASTPLDNNGFASVEQSSRESDSPADHSREADSGGSISPGPPAPRRTGLRPDRASRRPTDRDEARRREAREEARWQAERADRRAEVQAAEDRADRRAALQAEDRRAERREDHAQALAIAALGRTPHRLGVALSTFRSFAGADGTDGASYLDEFTGLLGTHSIPPAMWPKELFLKLTEKAAKWYATEFGHLQSGDFPPFAAMCSAFLHEYSPRYQAAEAFQALQSAPRQPGTTGQEALQGLAELELRLRRLGVRNPGPDEQGAYRLQNLLSSPELQRWTSLANASDISDAALNELELPSTSAALSRHSCSAETREAFFTRRSAHLRNFLRDQGRAATGSRHVGLAPVRAAVVAAADTDSAPAEVVRPPPPAVGEAARVAAVRAWQQFADRDDLPPEYMGSNKDPQHLTANRAIVARRLANKECWRCPEDKIVAGQHHGACRFHGFHALASDTAACPTVPGTSRHGKRASTGSRR